MRFEWMRPAGLALTLLCCALVPAHAVDNETARLDTAYGLEDSERFEEAVAAFEELAAEGSAEAHHHLGFIFSDGLGVARDLEKARLHFRAAADLGVDESLVALIYILDDATDIAVPPDPAAAALTVLELSRRNLPMAADTLSFWSDALKRSVQRALGETGLYSGGVDGLIGAGTLRALERYANLRTQPPVLANEPAAGQFVFVAPGRIQAVDLASDVDAAALRRAAPTLVIARADHGPVVIRRSEDGVRLVVLSGRRHDRLRLFADGPDPVRLFPDSSFGALAERVFLTDCYAAPAAVLETAAVTALAQGDGDEAGRYDLCPLPGGDLAMLFASPVDSGTDGRPDGDALFLGLVIDPPQADPLDRP
ncbi:MAG: SEL1-like repeat protein [Hyphomicrobiaceae bacterium]|nr:SEL1-like repeat protein [Hyphomicrobiaceae bacterium]